MTYEDSHRQSDLTNDCASQGIEGTYITYPPDYVPEEEDPLRGIRFVVTSTLGVYTRHQVPNLFSPNPPPDPSLRDLVERILPLATYYTAITSFVEIRSHLEYGLVNHALCAAIRDMLKVSSHLFVRGIC